MAQDSPTKTCAQCDRPVRARGLCSTHYNQTQSNRHRKTTVACAVCGNAVARATHSDRAHVCSAPCRAALAGRTSGTGKYDWARDAANRARQAGAHIIEVFTDIEIHERYGWMCYLCGTAVDRRVDPLHPDAPSIDHMVPLSKGGQHTRSNVACAHLHCNSSKQDRPAPMPHAV